MTVKGTWATPRKELSTEPGTQQVLSKHQLSLPSLLWRVIPDGTSPAKQGSTCLAASLPYLPSPSLSLKGSPVTGWPDEVMAGLPQRGAFVSRAQPILSGVRFYITCCGPLSLKKFTSPTWEPSPSLWAPWIGCRCSVPLPMLFRRCRPIFCRDGRKANSSISCSWHSAWGPQYFQGAHKNG